MSRCRGQRTARDPGQHVVSRLGSAALPDWFVSVHIGWESVSPPATCRWLLCARPGLLNCTSSALAPASRNDKQ
eukprot:365145-Chlamydomonas_euryale.AAC.27